MSDLVAARRLTNNALTNYLAAGWLAALTLLLLPVYLRALGAEQWGLLAICITVQGFLNLLDVGLGQIMPRDIARSDGNPSAVARTFDLYSRAYLVLAAVGLMLGLAAIPWVLSYWISAKYGIPDNAWQVLTLIVFQFAFQFANNAHTGYWNGMQLQARANYRQCLFSTLKHAGALSAIYAWRADALGYLLPFATLSLLEWLFNRRRVCADLSGVVRVPLSGADYRRLMRDTGVLATGILIGMLVSQIDRLVLSHQVDLAVYGRYLVVANVGLAFLQLQYPIMRAVFPSIMRSKDGHVGAPSQRLLWTLIGVCVLPCAVVAIAAPWLLHVWTGSAQIVDEGVTPLRLILAAVAINAIYHYVYLLLLARNMDRSIMYINGVILLVVVPVTIMLAGTYGTIAGGMCWLLSSVLQLALGSLWLFARATMSVQRGQ